MSKSKQSGNKIIWGMGISKHVGFLVFLVCFSFVISSNVHAWYNCFNTTRSTLTDLALIGPNQYNEYKELLEALNEKYLKSKVDMGKVYDSVFTVINHFRDYYVDNAWQDTRVLFDTSIKMFPDFARGHVKFHDGFIIDPGVSVMLDIADPVSGVIDAGPGGLNVGATGEISLLGPLTLAANASMPNGAMIDGRGNTVSFEGNFVLPKNKRLRIMSDTVFDGYGNTFAFGQDAQIIVDHGVTVTLMNMTITNTSNGYYKQIFSPLGPKSRVCLQDVSLELHDNIVFRLGRLYIHGDVIVSGPYSFMYCSDSPGYIQDGALWHFHRDATLLYNPPIDNDNLIRMLGAYATLSFDEATLASFGTPLRLSQGMLLLDNDVTITSPMVKPSASRMLIKHVVNQDISLQSSASSSSAPDNAQSVAWSPDGKYLAAAFNVDTDNTNVQVFRLDGSNLTHVVNAPATTNYARSVSWSPDGKYLAVAFFVTGGNNVQVFRFNGNSLTHVATASTTDNARSVAWSPDGKYLAAAFNVAANNNVQVFRFNGSNLTLVSNVVYAPDNATSVAWSPNGMYLAATFDVDVAPVDSENPRPYPLQVFLFDGSSLRLLTHAPLIATTDFLNEIGVSNKAQSVAWSPDGVYLAVAFDVASDQNPVQVFRFDGNSLSVLNLSAEPQLDDITNNWTVRHIDNAPAKANNALSVSWSPDGVYLAAGFYSTGNDKAVQTYRFNGDSLSFVATALTMTGSVQSVAWRPGGTQLATALNVTSGSNVKTFGFDGSEQKTFSDVFKYKRFTAAGNDSLLCPDYRMDLLSWSSDGRYLAGSNWGQFYIYSFDGSNLTNIFSQNLGAENRIRFIVWHPYENYVAVALESEVKIYSFDGSGCIEVDMFSDSSQLPESINAISWSPDGTHLAVAGSPRRQYFYRNLYQLLLLQPFKVKICEKPRENAVVILTFDGENLNFCENMVWIPWTANDVSWSPDGKYLAIAFDKDNESDEEGEEPRVLVCHFKLQNNIMTLLRRYLKKLINLRPSVGTNLLEKIAYGILDKTDAYTKPLLDALRIVGEFKGKADTNALSVAWSPDGSYLAAGFSDKTQILRFNSTVVLDMSLFLERVDHYVGQIEFDFLRNFLRSIFRTILNVDNSFGLQDVLFPVAEFCWDEPSQFGSTFSFGSLSWSPDGEYLADTKMILGEGYKFSVFRFDGSSLTTIPNIPDLTGTIYGVRSVAWRPDGAYLVVGVAGGSMGIYPFGDNGSEDEWESTGVIFGDSSVSDGEGDLDVRVLGGAHVNVCGHIVDEA